MKVKQKLLKTDHDRELKAKLQAQLDDPKKSYDAVLRYVQNEIVEAVRITSFSYNVPCFLEDGAFALARAVEEINGFTTQQNTKKVSGEDPPRMIDVRFADGTRKKVPFGTINLPAFGKDAYIEMQYDSVNLILSGQCEKRFVKLMDDIVERTMELLRTDSIYKGKAIKIINSGSPQFIDLGSVSNIELFLTPEAQFSTQPIEARIEKTDACIANGIDIKFGALLEGNYGTGKTLYAFKLAAKAIENEWTFVYCPDPGMTLHAMQVANRMSENGKGVVLFIEDIDKVLHERTNSTNEISLLMDGGESKAKNVITILTTNHIDLINPTFLRGKRIGSVITLSHPDAATAKRIIEKTLIDQMGQSLIDGDITPAAEEIEKLRIVPAFVAEIMDRVKSHLIYSSKTKINCEDIMLAIKSYSKQMEIATVKSSKKTNVETLVDHVKELFPSLSQPAIRQAVEDTFIEYGLRKPGQ